MQETELLPRPRRPWDLSSPDDRDYLALLGPGLVCVWPPAQAPGMWATNGGAWVHVAPSGAVTAFNGKVDVGQDNRTALRILVADELGVAPEVVDLVQGDTDLCPFDVGTFGSRSMPDAGEALRRAAAGARAALAGLAVPNPSPTAVESSCSTRSRASHRPPSVGSSAAVGMRHPTSTRSPARGGTRQISPGPR